MCPKIVDKGVRKKEILLAAMRIVARKGIKNITIDEIAVSAGIGKGTIYEYFSSKEEIFGAAIIEFLDKIEELQAKRFFRATTPRAKLKAILDSWIDASKEEDEELMTLMVDVWAEGVRQSNLEFKEVFDLKKVYDQYRDIVSAIIDDGINRGEFRKVNSGIVAGLFLATVDGLMIQWLLDKENLDLNKSADALFDTFINGITAQNN
ncbi:TetR/AcrR family transcriptional regulator [candidate division KSB1 bacterium]